MTDSTIRIISRAIFIFCALTLVSFVVVQRISPFGRYLSYSTNSVDSPIELVPINRYEQITSNEGSNEYRLINDIIYFTTQLNAAFDTAKVVITYKNRASNQNIYVGYQDQEAWHYTSALLDAPVLDSLISLGWKKTDTKPNIYQKIPKYQNFDQFLTNPPPNEPIGIFNFDQNIFRQTYLPNYQPSNQETEINLPLRGKVVFYTYVSNESFKLTVSKKDLNLYPDPDLVNIDIYKEDDIVYSAQIDDDGIVDDSGKSNSDQQIYIQNPGPELPEPGVYKVVIDAGGDSVITKIKTNLHKIVFDSPIYPISNKEVYPNIVNQTQSNQFYSDARQLNLTTFHKNTEQTVQIGTESAELKFKQELIATPSASSDLTEIILPKSDVQLRAKLGHFAISQDNYFQPTRYKLQNISNPDDLDNLNYIITDYTTPEMDGEWKKGIIEFDLRNAYIKNGTLRWILKTPGLKENGNEIIIKKIELEFVKKPLLKS